MTCVHHSINFFLKKHKATDILNRVDWLNNLRYSCTTKYYTAVEKTKANFFSCFDNNWCPKAAGSLSRMYAVLFSGIALWRVIKHGARKKGCTARLHGCLDFLTAFPAAQHRKLKQGQPGSAWRQTSGFWALNVNFLLVHINFTKCWFLLAFSYTCVACLGVCSFFFFLPV